ncbi:MAG: lipopolysaccharide heptosyltransferase I [Gammaproteobacteria bacterium]|nr:lipopolysaccharide heptosyltransferase I [Gammaproteobacteria bacterium]
MKVLIIKTSSMGDVIHTLPAIVDAKNAIPDIEFDWVVEEAFADIPKLSSSIRKIIPVALRRWRKNWLKAFTSREINGFLQKLRAEKYDYIIDAQGLIKSAIISKCARGISVGFDFKSAREPLAACLYQKRFRVAKDQHAILRIRQLFAQALNYKLPESEPDYGLNISSGEDESEYKLLFIHGTSRAEKCWAEEKWIGLACLAGKARFTIYLSWGNSLELERAERIAAACERIKILPQMTLYELANFMAGVCAVVTVDTGLGHLAAALSVPTIALYGPTDPKLIGTVGKNQRHILHFENVTGKEVWQELQTSLSCNKLFLNKLIANVELF